MRFLGFVVTSAALVLSACGGGDKANTDSSASAAAAKPDSTPTATATPSGTTAAPITGQTVEVKMIGDASGYRFEPANVTIKPGDGIKWVFVSSGPHDVTFDAASIPADAKAVLSANMPEQEGELKSKMLNAEGETYTVSFAGVPAGTYNYVCTPHMGMGMKGSITVKP